MALSSSGTLPLIHCPSPPPSVDSLGIASPEIRRTKTRGKRQDVMKRQAVPQQRKLGRRHSRNALGLKETAGAEVEASRRRGKENQQRITPEGDSRSEGGLQPQTDGLFQPATNEAGIPFMTARFTLFMGRKAKMMKSMILGMAMLAVLLPTASAQYQGWPHSGSLYILTTPDGANLPATAALEEFPAARATEPRLLRFQPGKGARRGYPLRHRRRQTVGIPDR